MTLDDVMHAGIEPALAWLPPAMTSPNAIVMLLAIGLQESRFEYRWQVLNTPGVKGPARSFWQGEQGGGMVAGVMRHKATEALARAACKYHGVTFTTKEVWLAIENNDMLAATLARLLLWSDPAGLPAPTDEASAWAMYLRVWRPGAHERGSPAKRASLRAEWTSHHKAARNHTGFP